MRFIFTNFLSSCDKSPHKNFPDIDKKQKGTQTGDRPVCVPNQEEGEMKKNCYDYIIPG